MDHKVIYEWHTSLFYNHPDGVFTLGLDGRILTSNAVFEKMSGFQQKSNAEQYLQDFVSPEYSNLIDENFTKSSQGCSVNYELRSKYREGRYYDWEIHSFPIIINQEIVGVYGICRDISERKCKDSELRLLQQGNEVNPYGMVILETNQTGMTAVYANPAFTKITQYTIDDIIAKPCPLLHGPETDQISIQKINSAIKHQHEVDVVLKCYKKNGTAFWNHLLIRPVFGLNNACTHFVLIHQDVSEQKIQDDHFKFQVNHDLGTGLPNQSLLYNALKKEYCETLAESSNLAVLYLDLDNFQPINDELGHQIGNQVLTIVAQRLRQITQPGQMLARMAGDEFCILYPRYKHDRDVISLANLILDTLSKPINLEKNRIHISASIGIASHNTLIITAHELIKHATQCVEKSKRQGRNTWQWHRESRFQRSTHGVTVRQEIHDALENSQFKLFYQPVVDAKNGKTHGVEALVRWHHPRRGIILPGEFIHLAEQTGQIIPLGLWVLEQACQDIVRFNAQHQQQLSVAVNISSLQFYRDSFLSDVRAVLQRTKISPTLLELEVTESVLLDSTEKVIEVMWAIQELGAKIAIDDFGTGFSSLSYLGDLPTHKLKLDRRFVQRVLHDQRTDAIVEAVVNMAHRMDMTVVAEGIETYQQKHELIARGCDQLQGFLFAKPMPLETLAAEGLLIRN